MATTPTLVPVGSLQLDLQRRLLIGDRGEVPLSPLSSRFLARLAERRGHTVSRSDLIEDLWSGNFHVGEQALNRVASETRRAAAEAGSSDLIETVQKSGYRLQTRAAEAAWRPVPKYGAAAKIGWVLLGAALLVAALAWLIDSAIGLVWLSRLPN